MRDAYTKGIAQLRWQQTQDEALRELLNAQHEEMHDRLRRREQESANLRQSLLFADAEIGATLTSRCLQELLAVKLEIATTKQLIIATKEYSQQRREEQKNRKSELEKKRDKYLQERRDMLTQELHRMQDLAQRNVASQSEVRRLRAEKSAWEMQQVERQLDLAVEDHGSNYDEQLANLRIKLESLIARDKAVREFLDNVTKTSRESRKLRGLIRDEEDLAARINRIAERFDEIALRQAETESLIHLIEDHLEDQGNADDASGEQPSDNDDE